MVEQWPKDFDHFCRAEVERLAIFCRPPVKKILEREKSILLSIIEASANFSLTNLDRTVVAGCKEDTRGTENFGDGLYSPSRTIGLDLLAMRLR